MHQVPISQARSSIADLVDEATRTGEPIALTRHGRTVAVLVNPAVFEKLDSDLELAYDRALLELALEEARDPGNRVSLEQVKAELGL